MPPPDAAKRRIYGYMIGLRPNDVAIHIRNQDERIQELLEANNALVEKTRELSAQIAEMEDWYKEGGKRQDVIDALDPNVTKYAYIGEFKFKQYIVGHDGNEYCIEHTVPWTTVKDIMKAIRAKAGLP